MKKKDFEWTKNIEIPLTCVYNKELFPNKRSKIDTIDEYLEKWVNDYINDFNNRIVIRVGKEMKTKVDPVLINTFNKFLNQTKIPTQKAVESHRFGMQIENLIGDLVEQYIDSKSDITHWSYCWGKCVKSVDFCDESNFLLQVKNRSNTENSSSDKVREGTTIVKWFRISANTNKTYWDDLNQKIGKSDLFSEVEFQKYADSMFDKNPKLIYLKSYNNIL